MKKIIILILFLSILSYGFGAEYLIPYKFKSGDIISADAINEVFNYINNSAKTLAVTDLEGDWTGKAYSNNDGAYETVAGWQVSEKEMYIFLNTNITFTTDNITTSAPNPFLCNVSSSCNSAYEIIGNSLLFKTVLVNGYTVIAKYTVKKISESRIVLEADSSSTYWVPKIILDKQNMPPTPPSELSISSSDYKIFLSWQDNSNDETGFKILRKNTLEGEFAEIATTMADILTYEDTVTAAGTYWYRVKSTNANGDFLGSNEVKITVEETPTE